jgi:hypothetical protein
MKRQKPLALLLSLALLLFLLSACSPSPNPSFASTPAESSATTQLSVVVSSPETVSVSAPEAASESSSSVAAGDDDAQLAAYLDGLVAALNDPQSDNLYYYSLDDNGVFFTISMPAFDYFILNLDLVSASDLDAARKIALDFVSGEFAEDLIARIRTNGGASKSVYITLGGNYGICMCSRDLFVFIDNLKK